MSRDRRTPARIVVAVCVAVGLLAPAAHARPLDDAVADASARCADYANRAAAQRAADTVDGDGDGIYCESLPMPMPDTRVADGHADAEPVARRRPTVR
jgi:hypothetical protein